MICLAGEGNRLSVLLMGMRKPETGGRELASRPGEIIWGPWGTHYPFYLSWIAAAATIGLTLATVPLFRFVRKSQVLFSFRGIPIPADSRAAMDVLGSCDSLWVLLSVFVLMHPSTWVFDARGRGSPFFVRRSVVEWHSRNSRGLVMLGFILWQVTRLPP